MSNASLAVVDGEVIPQSPLAVASKQQNAAELYRHATDVAGACGEIVKRTAQSIQGRKYVKVEGWQAIATTYGCVASARDVERTATGFRCIGEVRRMSDGQVIATAEGFLGDDEPVWSGGIDANGKKHVARPEFAKRAMCQTRSISRACRSAFAFVVVLIDNSLSTTPAEEMEGLGLGGVDAGQSMPPPAGVDKLREQVTARPAPASPPRPEGAPATSDVSFAFGKSKGIPLSKMDENSLSFYASAFKRDLESTDPAKTKWADKTRQQLEAVNAELRFRGLPA